MFRPCLLFLTLLAPLAWAGPQDPEIPEETGETLPPVDIVSAWFSSYVPPGPSLGVPEADCLRAACGDAFRVTVRVVDLTVAAPLADEDPSTLRYHYTFRFLADAWPVPITVRCVLALADVALGGADLAAGLDAGTRCAVDEPDGLGAPLLVVGSQLTGPGRQLVLGECAVDRVADTLTVTLVEGAMDVGPGLVLSDLQVTTAVSGFPDPAERPADSMGSRRAWVYA